MLYIVTLIRDLAKKIPQFSTNIRQHNSSLICIVTLLLLIIVPLVRGLTKKSYNFPPIYTTLLYSSYLI